MIRHTAVAADLRKGQIARWLDNSDVKSDPILRSFNINVDLRMVQLDGRVLSGPDIKYGGNKIVDSKEIGEKGAWDHRSKWFLNPMKIDNWMVLNLMGPRAGESVEKFIGTFINGMITKFVPNFLPNF